MSRVEFLKWWEFHRRNPIDPVSLYQKPAALIAHTVAHSGMNGSRATFDDYLQQLVPPNPDDEAWAIWRSFLS